MPYTYTIITLVDIVGCIAMIILSIACLNIALDLRRKDPENAMNNYLAWLFSAIIAFCLSRSMGHIAKHLMLFMGMSDLWRRTSPYSGAVNTITFIIIFAVTLFFRDMLSIMAKMTRDKERIQKTGSQLLELNQDIETIVADRTRTELALKFAHEIRNPVVIIGGLLCRMKGIFENARKIKEYDMIMEQTSRLDMLIKKIEEVQPEIEKKFIPVDLNQITRDVIDLVEAAAQSRQISIVAEYSPMPLIFQCNSQLIKAALHHLFFNAVEVCGPGNTIEVSTKGCKKGVELFIKDDGPGIPDEILQHIFQPFYSTIKGSTGLGLPYVRQIISEHMGIIDIQSREGKGTTVHLVFPPMLGELKRSPVNPKS